MLRVITLLCLALLSLGTGQAASLAPQHPAHGAPIYWDFGATQKLPSWIKFNRGISFPGPCGGCATTAMYTDASGAAYTKLTDTQAGFVPGGVQSFEAVYGLFLNNDINYNSGPATQTITIYSGNGPHASLSCNGSGSITTAVTSGTATGTGALACNAGTFQNLVISGSTTVITATVSGTVYWADFQQGGGGGGDVRFAPVPHFIVGSSALFRPADTLQIIGPALAMMSANGHVSELGEMTLMGDCTGEDTCFFWGGTQFNISGVAANGESDLSLTWLTAYPNFLPAASLYVDVVNDGGISGWPVPWALGSPQRVAMANLPGAYPMAFNGMIAIYRPLTYYPVPSYMIQLPPTSGKPLSLYLGGSGNQGGYGAENCNCIVSKFAIYPWILSNSEFMTKTTLGVALP